jgi:hypothetical protein
MERHGLAALLSTVAALIGVPLIVGLCRLHARSAAVVTLKVPGTPEQLYRIEGIRRSRSTLSLLALKRGDISFVARSNSPSNARSLSSRSRSHDPTCS